MSADEIVNAIREKDLHLLTLEPHARPWVRVQRPSNRLVLIFTNSRSEKRNEKKKHHPIQTEHEVFFIVLKSITNSDILYLIFYFSVL
jgi:hypothetical protein